MEPSTGNSTISAGAPPPIVTLTAAALAQVRRTLARGNRESHVLAIRVVRAGCNGYGYDVQVQAAAREGDLQWTQEGVVMATDAESVKLLQGTEIDYARSDLGGSFTFSNPNARSTCGCGTSFSP
jgi:iron-sulfur cluster assembly accessory protein